MNPKRIRWDQIKEIKDPSSKKFHIDHINRKHPSRAFYPVPERYRIFTHGGNNYLVVNGNNGKIVDSLKFGDNWLSFSIPMYDIAYVLGIDTLITKRLVEKNVYSIGWIYNTPTAIREITIGIFSSYIKHLDKDDNLTRISLLDGKIRVRATVKMFTSKPNILKTPSKMNPGVSYVVNAVVCRLGFENAMRKDLAQLTIDYTRTDEEDEKIDIYVEKGPT